MTKVARTIQYLCNCPEPGCGFQAMDLKPRYAANTVYMHVIHEHDKLPDLQVILNTVQEVLPESMRTKNHEGGQSHEQKTA